MHAETLSLLHAKRPDMPIFIPSFKTRSTLRPLASMGFTNIIPLPFNQIFQVNDSPLYLSILKSGDFRDDSGIYLKFGEFEALLTVDSSILNHLILPQNISFLATSFAGGASGHPWCFEHYSIEERKQISARRLQAVRHSVSQYIQATKPQCYVPYAGYFGELAQRDTFIRTNNVKNNLETIQDLVTQQFPDVRFVNPLDTDQIVFESKPTQRPQTSCHKNSQPLDTEFVNRYLKQEVSPSQQQLNALILEYFQHAQFQDSLTLFLQPTSEDFSPNLYGYMINFSQPAGPDIHGPLTPEDLLSEYETRPTDNRKLLIRVRAAALYDVLRSKKPWEELSIGFQCRIHRTPDVYNSDFWYHFSNVYIEYTSQVS
ncbi:MAG: hypothetical protein KDA77_14885, partial [Planctomycetaceae bacterium]|nr:hypothetical protein [Planctomycetaceae bacterium]